MDSGEGMEAREIYIENFGRTYNLQFVRPQAPQLVLPERLVASIMIRSGQMEKSHQTFLGRLASGLCRVWVAGFRPVLGSSAPSCFHTNLEAVQPSFAKMYLFLT